MKRNPEKRHNYRPLQFSPVINHVSLVFEYMQKETYIYEKRPRKEALLQGSTESGRCGVVHVGFLARAAVYENISKETYIYEKRPKKIIFTAVQKRWA